MQMFPFVDGFGSYEIVGSAALSTILVSSKKYRKEVQGVSSALRPGFS